MFSVEHWRWSQTISGVVAQDGAVGDMIFDAMPPCGATASGMKLDLQYRQLISPLTRAMEVHGIFSEGIAQIPFFCMRGIALQARMPGGVECLLLGLFGFGKRGLLEKGYFSEKSCSRDSRENERF